MRKKSDRGKIKSTDTAKNETPEKPKKSHRHSRRRKKSSSSSEDGGEVREVIKNIPQPSEVEIENIELPQEEQTNVSEQSSKPLEDLKEKPKDDNQACMPEEKQPTQDNAEDELKEKEESSLWKVQSANSGGSEIQKLKICRQRPADSPEIGESSLRKRLSRGNKDGRSTDDSTHEESEKDSKKSKHKIRSSSRNSPTVVCDLSEESPTKIKIINVSNISTENKGGNVSKIELSSDSIEKTQHLKPLDFTEDSQMSDTLDIALPADEPLPPKINPVESEGTVLCQLEPNRETSNVSNSEEPGKGDSEKTHSLKDDVKQSDEKKPPPPSPSPNNETLATTSSRSSSNSDTSDGESVPDKKKRRCNTVLSTIKRIESSPDHSKLKTSDSKEECEKKEDEEERRNSPELEERKVEDNKKENEKEQSPPQAKEIKPEERNGDQIDCERRAPRKRRWGSNRSNRVEKNQIITISTNSLKSLIPDAKPVSAEELQLSVEEEEGQLDDDDEEDEVVAMVTKEEEKELERERQKEEKERHKEEKERQKEEKERQKEAREKEKEKAIEDKKRRLERFEKIKTEHVPPVKIKEEGSRKIHLISEETKKLRHSPTPPRRKSTCVLYITHLVRPFTVQQLKNLLLRTGTIAENGFWIDKIKSKCYVEYTTEDAAVETRHALHSVKWPTSNPKTLVVEFSTHDDLVMAQALSEEPEVPRKAEPLTMVEGWVAEQARIKDKSRRTVVREWDVGKPEHPDEILDQELKIKERKEQERRARKERHHRSSTPDADHPSRKTRKKDEETPVKLLDDLFRKTKTSPCIYWLPLTQEQIAVKEEIRRQHMAEHERRMAELKKADVARRDREKRNRK